MKTSSMGELSGRSDGPAQGCSYSSEHRWSSLRIDWTEPLSPDRGAAAQKKTGPWTSPRPRPLEQVCRLDQKGRCRLNTNLPHKIAQSNGPEQRTGKPPGRDGTAGAFQCVSDAALFPYRVNWY